MKHVSRLGSSPDVAKVAGGVEEGSETVLRRTTDFWSCYRVSRTSCAAPFGVWARV